MWFVVFQGSKLSLFQRFEVLIMIHYSQWTKKNQDKLLDPPASNHFLDYLFEIFGEGKFLDLQIR